MNEADSAVIALHLVFEDDLKAWAADQSPMANQWMVSQNWKAERDRLLLVPNADGTVALAAYGLGRKQAICLWHTAGLADRLPARRFKLAQSFGDSEATQIYLGFVCGAYRFDRYRRAKLDVAPSLAAPDNANVEYVRLAAEATAWARDWINTPAADFGPAELAAAARDIAARHGAAYREWQGDELLAQNFPAIHAVGRAGPVPRLCELRWSPPAAGDFPQIAIVGKGVCFDSGGLDIKSASSMLLMKKDMGGAAVALALAHMLMSSGIRAKLHVLIPAVENSISANAYRPGDVLMTRKGLSVEVGNTDAEGRLVLCDALAAADAERPELILDFATLTGAARVALGPELPALFGSDAMMVDEILRQGVLTHDPLWPLPLWPGYEDELASRIADLNNVSPSGYAGAIFGALFLRRFVTLAQSWVHVDLYAWNSKDRPGRPVGAEAQCVRAFYAYLRARFGTV